MSERAARTWLSSHHDVIPALEVLHRQALETLEDQSKTVGDLAAIIALDPGMSVSLYHEVNARLLHGRKQRVESVQTALSLLGDSAIADLVMQHKVLGETHPDALRRQSYHQLISRSYHLLAQLERFVGLQGINALDEIRSAALLHNIGEFCACLFDHERYQQYLTNFRTNGVDANSSKVVYSFNFHQLGRIYAEKSYLPKLVSESLEENVPSGRKARLIQLAADVSHQAEVGWYHSAMHATEQVCAAYLNQPLAGFDKHLQQVAIAAARSCPFDDVLPAASRLIMLPEPKTATKPAPKVATKPAADGHEFDNRITALLQTSNPTQAQLLDLLLVHLHDELFLSRVVLMLLSPDQKKLGTRAGKGIDEHSPIRTLVIDIDRESLLKTLLRKPQSVWVDEDSYHKFESALPPRFKGSFLHESFFLMSLHVGARPMGLIFCDRAQAVSKLDKMSYVKFKSAITLISKALTSLARRRQQAAS
jgi:hypothetical protein